MPDLKQFLLPDVGEGLTEAEIIKWDVAPGDTVTVNQTLVEIETAKAAVELPSPYAGVVTALHVAAGDTVDVGRPIITIDTAPDGGRCGSRAAAGSAVGGPANGVHGEGRQAVLVGYGPRADGPSAGARSRVGHAVAPDPAWCRARASSRGSSRAGCARAGVASLARAATGAGQAAGAAAGQEPRRRPRRRSPRPARTARCRAMTSSRRRVGSQRAGRPVQHRRIDGGARDPHPGARRPQAHRGRDGRVGVHRAARHRVPDRRRQRDDGAARADRRPARVSRREGVAARAAGQGGDHRGARRRPRSTRAGTRRPARSCSSTTSTSASPRRPRAG